MNPFLINEPTCISFSGGRTSAYMLYRILEAHQMSLPEEAIVCFANTGKEAEESIRFVKAIEDNWGVEIHWLEYQNAEPSFKRVNFETASRNGEPFESLIHKKGYLPNPMSRYCSIEMKIRVIHKYLKSLGWSDHSERCVGLGLGLMSKEGHQRLKNTEPLWLLLESQKKLLASFGVIVHLTWNYQTTMA